MFVENEKNKRKQEIKQSGQRSKGKKPTYTKSNRIRNEDNYEELNSIIKEVLEEILLEEKFNLFWRRMYQLIRVNGHITNVITKQKKFDVYPPSAYASGALVKYKAAGGSWKNWDNHERSNDGSCWVGYQQIGMKERMVGKRYPNCVKEEV